MAPRIEDYAPIGDCKTVALVGRDGSIDWLCWPSFDSPSGFAALLGDANHGRWLLAPKHPPLTAARSYRPGTLILETEFKAAKPIDGRQYGGRSAVDRCRRPHCTLVAGGSLSLDPHDHHTVCQGVSGTARSNGNRRA